MALIRLNPNEEIIESVRANFGVHGGKLFLTNERVVFKTNMGSEIWGAYLRDLDSYYLQSTFGINANLVVRSGGVDNVFLVPKGAGTNFDDCMSRTIQNLDDDSFSSQANQQNDFNQEEGYEIDFDEDNHIEYDDESSNHTREFQYQQNKVKYPWALALGMILVVVVGIFIFTRMGSSGSSESDLDGEYYLYRNTVFHQIDGVIEIKNGEFKKSHGNMVFDSGKYNYDEDSEILHLGKLNFKVAREDGEVKALEKITADEVPVGAEIYYKQ